jgi:3'5'-cyclic nucleotide phosphodiesterase
MSTRMENGDIPRIIENKSGLYEGNLKPYFRAIFLNAKNLNNPYHNFRHMLHIVWLCYKACEYYRSQLTPRQMRVLLIAALFHDFDHPGHPHPGREEPDGVNISLAIAGLRRHAAPEDRPYLPELEALIEVTRFPYPPREAALELCEQIIRDADLAQALSPVWLQQVVIGLAREWHVAPLDVLRMQPSFLGELRFNTEWARELFPRKFIEQKIDEAQQLLVFVAADPKTGG